MSPSKNINSIRDPRDLNVLFMAYSTSNGALHYHWTSLATRIKELGPNIIVFSGLPEEEAGLSAKLRRNGVRLYKTPFANSSSFPNLLRNSYTLSKIIRSEKVSVIHANGIRHMIPAFLASKLFRKKVKIVVTLHSTLHGTRFEGTAYLFSAILMNICADLVLPVSEETGAKLKSHGLIKNVFPVHNGIDLETFHEALCESEYTKALANSCIGDVKIGYFATMVHRKGHRYLLEAFSRISKTHPKMKIILSGDGPLRNELATLSQILGIREKVIFTGRTTYRDLFGILNLIDIYAFPSLSELFPFAIVEAMAAGKPVVATNVGGISEIIDNEINGLLVPAKNSQALVKAINQLIDDPKSAKLLGKRAKETVENGFDSPIIAHLLVKCYKSVCSNLKPNYERK